MVLWFYPFLLQKSPVFEEAHPTQAGVQPARLALSCTPLPLETTPKTSLSPMGTTDSLPSAVQAALQGHRSQGTHRGEAELETRAPLNPHMAAPLHHCIFCRPLLRKHCHHPKALLGVSPCHRVPGRPPLPMQNCHALPNAIPVV